jgi:hypothetical protein
MMQKWNRIVIFRKGIRYCTLHIDGVSDTMRDQISHISVSKMEVRAIINSNTNE